MAYAMPPDSRFSDAALSEAQAAIESSQAHKASKGEKKVDKFGLATFFEPCFKHMLIKTLGRAQRMASSESREDS